MYLALEQKETEQNLCLMLPKRKVLKVVKARLNYSGKWNIK